MADLNLIVSQIRQRLEILYQEIDKIEGGGGGSPEDTYTKEEADTLFVKKVAGKGLSTNDFTNAYMNQIGTNTTDIANLALDVNSIFEQEGFTASQGSTLPADVASVLAKHRPFVMNGRTWYFLSEGDGILDYFAIDNNTNGHPEIHYASIKESNRKLTVLEKFGTDTTPIQNSENLITSGGVYASLQDKPSVLTSVITPNPSVAFSSFQYSAIVMGDIITINIRAVPTNALAVSTSSFLASIAAGYRPPYLIAGPCYANNVLRQCWVNNEGGIRMRVDEEIPAGSLIVLSFSFNHNDDKWVDVSPAPTLNSISPASLSKLNTASLDVENPEDEPF